MYCEYEYFPKGLIYMNKRGERKLQRAVLSVVLTVVLALSANISVIGAVWTGDTATPSMNSDGYYLIDSGEKLSWFSQCVNSGNTTIKALQTADIDLGNRKFMPIGTAENVFKGVYDGNGFEIKNLFIDNEDEGNGLFGYVGTSVTITTERDSFGNIYYTKNYTPAEINKVVLVDANIKGGKNTGAIAGYSDGGYIYECQVNGTVTGYSSNVGGIVGYNKMGYIVNCLNNGEVTAATLRVGGIAGYNYSNSYIIGCCNMGNVSGDSYVGGIAGTNSGSIISHSYGKGTVSATTNICGGLVGYVA